MAHLLGLNFLRLGITAETRHCNARPRPPKVWPRRNHSRCVKIKALNVMVPPPDQP